MDDHSSNSLPFSTKQRQSLARRLIGWFDRSARDLPWRGTSDLYAIWVSEVMLQQTQVATVIPYYEEFLRQFPDVAALASASEERVLRLWEGLGYYRRARQLHAAARQVMAEHRGHFPTDYEAVRSLPGIGRYTAGAVLSIGLGARLPIIEANSIRVLSRLSLLRENPQSVAGQRQLWLLAEQLLPPRRVGTFNQALMELGSLVCTPKAPACEQCPISMHCRACALGLQDQIPTPAARTNYEDVAEVAVVIRRRGEVLVRKCQPGERWAGLWDFPRFAANGDIGASVAALVGVRIATPQHLATLKHGVTRFRITLDVYGAQHLRPAGQRSRPQKNSDVQWIAPRQLADVPLSVTGRKIAQLLLPAATRRTSPSAAAPRARSRRKRG
jgi:A/G-specific adenine glycosylase